MGIVGAALLALTAVQAINQIGQGHAEEAEANFNAVVTEGKAGLIDVEKDIESNQYFRAKGRALSTSLADVAAAGLKPTGSVLAVMLDTQKQMSLDQAIGQFNLEQEKRFTLAEAEAFRRGGAVAKRTGYSRAFSSVLRGASQYAMFKIKTKGQKDKPGETGEGK